MSNLAYRADSESIDLSAIRTDGGTQPRSAIYQNVVDDYAEALKAGATFPPVVLFYDGTDYWLADGFHRHAAHKAAGHGEIAADVRQGTRRDAVLFSVGANSQHGLRRTNEDKRRAVMTLLADEEWAKWSDREIARRAGVSNQFVSNLRPSVNGGQIERHAERNGVTYTIDTSNIGRFQPEIRPSSEPASVVHSLPDTTIAPIPANDNEAQNSRLASFSGDNEWYTPARYVELAREVMGSIDVDPASNDHAQKTVKAKTYYTAETDGLDKDWHGKVWMNPPYSQPEIAHFIEKLVEEYQSGRCIEAIVLTNNAGDTAWCHTLKAVSSRWCVTRGRIQFESLTRQSGAGAVGQIFFYFGPNPERFVDVFSEIGSVEMAA